MNEKILFIVAHPDDEVLSCGGAIQKFRKMGYMVKVHLITTRGLGHEADDARVRAFLQVMDFFQIALHSYTDLSNEDVEKMTVAELDADYIRPVVESFQPAMVFSHSVDDGNQHHAKIAKAVEIATRGVPLLYSFVPPENLPRSSRFRANTYVAINRTEAENKAKAFLKYDQDMGAHHIRSYEGIIADSSFHGKIVGVEYAEPYRAERVIL